MREILGRAPICFMISEAALFPKCPHFSIEYLLIKPNKKPAANKSPAPVVSTSSSISLLDLQDIQVYFQRQQILLILE